MKLSDDFLRMYHLIDEQPDIVDEIAKMVFEAPDTTERQGLLAFIYHEGIGVSADLDRSLELADKVTSDEGSGLGYFLLGYMCDNDEISGKAEGRLRRKYGHCNARQFYEKSAAVGDRWSVPSHQWLGDYYMDRKLGADPDKAVMHYETIAGDDAEAAGKLSDYYWGLIMPEYFEDAEWLSQLFKWTSVAVRLNPKGYSYRMGWIYADGLGCEKTLEKAVDFFRDTYEYGDWRGAAAIAKLLEEFMEDNPDMSEEDRTVYENDIKSFNELADSMREDESAKSSFPQD